MTFIVGPTFDAHVDKKEQAAQPGCTGLEGIVHSGILRVAHAPAISKRTVVTERKALEYEFKGEQ